MGAGHTVTVLYEVVPVGALEPDGAERRGDRPVVDPLKYQAAEPAAPVPPRPAAKIGYCDELLTVSNTSSG